MDGYTHFSGIRRTAYRPGTTSVLLRSTSVSRCRWECRPHQRRASGGEHCGTGSLTRVDSRYVRANDRSELSRSGCRRCGRSRCVVLVTGDRRRDSARTSMQHRCGLHVARRQVSNPRGAYRSARSFRRQRLRGMPPAPYAGAFRGQVHRGLGSRSGWNWVELHVLSGSLRGTRLPCRSPA